MMNVSLVHFIKGCVIIGAIGLLVLSRFYKKNNISEPKSYWAVLVFVSIISIFSYFQFGYNPKFGTFLNPHDFFHYYMGSKYSDEIGYNYLYESVLIADAENSRGHLVHKSYRSMDNYKKKSAAKVLRNKKKYKGMFSESRWIEFRGDVAEFKSRFIPKRWSGILLDKGYNASPVWNGFAKIITNIVDAKNIDYLVGFDLALVLAMFILIGRSFGLNAAFFSVIFFSTVFPMDYTHIRGAFLRLDWVTTIVFSICMLKKKNYKLAGFFMAYGAAARIFPAAFVFGIGAKALYESIRDKNINPKYLRFFISFFVSIGGLFLFSIIVGDGISQWKDFLAKVSFHDSDLSPMRVGFKYIFLNTHTNTFGAWRIFEADKQEMFIHYKTYWWIIQAFVLAAVFYLSTKLEDYEVVSIGYIQAFFLFAPTFYYQIMIIIPFMFFISKACSKDSRIYGASFMLLISVIMFGFDYLWKINLMFSYTFSILLLLLCVCIATTILVERFKEKRVVS